MTQTHLVTGPFPELWRDSKSVVVIDGIGLDGKVFVNDPSIEITLVKSPEILSRVDDVEFANFRSISESVFQRLVGELNRVHGTNQPERYWRIICGAWFLQFAQVWYLRWKVASEVLRLHGPTPYLRLDVKWQELLPVTHDEASLLFATDIWNHIAYCEAFKFVSKSDRLEKLVYAPEQNSELSKYRSVINFGLPRQSAKPKLESILAKLSPRPRVVLAGVTQSRSALVAMHLRLGMLPRLWRFSAKLTPQPVDASLREQIRLSKSTDVGFQEFLASSVSHHLPTVYLEGFKDLSMQTFNENILEKPPRAIFTNTLLHRSEQFKLWCANFVAQGKTKLFSGQHGGGYGVSRFPNWSELNEHAIVDGFLSWGNLSTSQIDLVACVQGSSVAYKPNYLGNLLIVLGPVTRQQNNFNLVNVHCNSSYFAQINSFIETLSPHIRSDIFVRPKSASAIGKPARVSAPQVSGLLNGFKNIDIGMRSLESELANCRMAVVTYNETTIPSNLMNNFPTIALWDSNFVSLNDRASSVYGRLAEAKILFHSPVEAAQHVTEIWSDIERWWNSDLVQNARRHYCENYAHKVRFTALTVASVIADNL